MRILPALFVLSLLAGYGYHAQSPAAEPGVIAGRVTSEAGAPLAGVRVDLLRDGRLVRTTLTNPRGEFRIERVPPGSYVVRATLPGYAARTQPTVTVGSAPVPSVPITLIDVTRDDRETAAKRPYAPAVAGLAAEQVSMFAGARVARDVRPPFNTEAYDHIEDNRFRRVAIDPVSTFSIDVDSASYSNVRRFLREGRLPPADAVRTEELLNYFRFDYREPDASRPFSVTTEVAKCPWNSRHRLALIGLQAPRVRDERVPPRNLVFLLDVSGSMMPANKLPLVKAAMKLLTDTLREEDRVAVVVYAGASGLALPSTPGSDKAVIHRAIDELEAGGSTNGASGIRLAYDVAADHLIEGGVNRVILATDGDFNVGVTSEGELVRLIEKERERGVFLSVIGVGTGNLKDATMEKLADKGNGNYSYFDTLHEARRVLIEEAGATLVTVAKDVKIQVEFNPAHVAGYRLIGYENRLLNREDFKDDRKDAGEIGAGHTVTALYELVPRGEELPGPDVEPLKYQDGSRPKATGHADEVMTVRLRYKEPGGSRSEEIVVPVKDRLATLSEHLGFAAAVAQFGMLLRGSEFKGTSTWESARELARRHRGTDAGGYRAEFIELLELAASLQEPTAERTRAR